MRSFYLLARWLKTSKRRHDIIRIEKKIDALTLKIDNLDFNNFKKLQIGLKYIDDNQSNKESNIEQFKLNLTPEQLFDNLFLQIESLLSIYCALPNLKFFPTTRGWAGSPDFLLKITELILKERPRFVLEASSGVSSVIIGLSLKLNNLGKALSIDHELFYTNATQENININNTEDISTVKYCQLRDYNIYGETCIWYETDHLDFSEGIDLLIIDGPPRTTQILARYPAIPILHEYFADRVLILLDDSNRKDEIIIIGKWINFLKNNNYTVTETTYQNFEKGLSILEVCRINKLEI